MAVSKTHSFEAIAEAVRGGIKHIGENKVQEAERKFQILEEAHPDCSFARHMVGHVQTNKVRKALKLFDIIQSVDSIKIGQAISKEAEKQKRKVDILVQVNTSGEATKYGVEPQESVNLVKSISELPNLNIKGLMTIGAFLPEPEDVRSCFIILRRLAEEISALNLPGVEMKYLSMGMTNDFETAIEEGASLVRIGTAIFGQRVVFDNS